MTVDKQRVAAREDLPTALNLGCGTDIRAESWNVDQVALEGVDQQLDLAKTPWDLPTGHFESIRCSHVLEHLPDQDAALQECERILAPGGRLDVRWPIRFNQWSDDTHQAVWLWKTPENKLDDHWQPHLDLQLVDRDCRLFPRAPSQRLRALQRRKFRLLFWLYGAGEWCWRPPGPTFGPFGGEFQVVFQKP